MRSATFVSLVLPLLASIRAATVCNGQAALCGQLYSNVTFVGAHDSYAVGSSVADNQDKSVTDQLNDGVRTLQIQTHNATDGIHLCHTSCDLLDGGLLSTYLTSVASWVDSNPTEVITILMVNIDDLPPTSFTSAYETSGLSNKTYSPYSASVQLDSWPTLGAMVDAGTTVVVFMDFEADYSSVPYIIDELSNMFEDAYDVTETGWSCNVNRTSGSAGSQMMLINHFLDTTYSLAGVQLFVPDKSALNTTNSQSSIDSHVSNCKSIWGRNPNHILFDYYDSNGNTPFDIVAALNGVAEPTNTVTAGTISTTAGTSATAVVSSTKIAGSAGRSAGLHGGAFLVGVLGLTLGAFAVM